MNNHPVIKSGKKWTIQMVLPYALVSIVTAVCCYVLFGSGFGVTPSASAQVNMAKIGEQAAGQITENAGKASTDQAAAPPASQAPPPGAAPANPSAVSTPGSEAVLNELEGSVGESAQAPGSEQTVYDTTPSGAYYVNSEGVGGPALTELTRADFLAAIEKVPEFQAAPPEAKPALLQSLIPVLFRFQVMVTPPKDYKEIRPGQKTPWSAGNLRRYSPFDIVGGGGPPIGKTKPVPPFPPLVQLNEPKNVVTSSQIASGLKLVGVVGEEGHYLAILTGAGQEKRLAIGDEIIRIGDDSFIVSDITLSSVRISNKKRPADQALIQFVSRQGIENVSISY
jgi:hypothetical protein